MNSSGKSGGGVLGLLSTMMFLQFFVWGAWYVTAANYMGKVGLGFSIGHIYTVGPIAALISPFFLGMIADRYFSTERVLGVLHIIGGVALLSSPWLAQWSADLYAQRIADWTALGLNPEEEGKKLFLIVEHLPFILIIFIHMLCYMPTLGLTNTIAFHNIKDGEKQFPVIRVFGTIGWIVACLVVSNWLEADMKALPFQIAGGGGIVLGFFSFFLPHTPPPAKGKKVTIKEILGLDALKLVKDPSYSIFLLSSLLICIPLAAYYAYAQVYVDASGFHAPAGTMSLGQMSEIIFMLLIPFFFVRLGVKWMLLIGMFAWAARYALFAMAAPTGVVWMVLFGIILHGICYDFFFVTGFIYTDKKANKEIRGQAQGLLVLVTQGLGLGIGAQIIQRLVINPNKLEGTIGVAREAGSPAVKALLEKHLADAPADTPVFQALSDVAGGFRKESAELLEQAAKATGDTAVELTAKADAAWQKASEILLQCHDWSAIWWIPAIMASAVLVLFFITFWDKSADGKKADS